MAGGPGGNNPFNNFGRQQDGSDAQSGHSPPEESRLRDEAVRRISGGVMEHRTDMVPLAHSMDGVIPGLNKWPCFQSYYDPLPSREGISPYDLNNPYSPNCPQNLRAFRPWEHRVAQEQPLYLDDPCASSKLVEQWAKSGFSYGVAHDLENWFRYKLGRVIVDTYHGDTSKTPEALGGLANTLQFQLNDQQNDERNLFRGVAWGIKFNEKNGEVTISASNRQGKDCTPPMILKVAAVPNDNGSNRASGDGRGGQPQQQSQQEQMAHQSAPRQDMQRRAQPQQYEQQRAQQQQQQMEQQQAQQQQGGSLGPFNVPYSGQDRQNNAVLPPAGSEISNPYGSTRLPDGTIKKNMGGGYPGHPDCFIMTPDGRYLQHWKALPNGQYDKENLS